MNTSQDPSLPLQGVKVLEFSHAILGPACGMVLADLGADLIHVEAPHGDYTRRLRGFGSGFFPFFNRNKRSLAVDIKTDDGKAILRKLITGTDVVIENFGPGTMERLGYGYEELSRLQPRLVYCALKGFLRGPYEQRQALDEIVQMMGGLAYMTGPPGQPLRAGSSIVDIGGAMFGVIGILLALQERERTGKGQLVKSGLFETTAFFMGQHMACAAQSDEPLPPMAARRDIWSIYQTFDTSTGEPVFIGITSDKHWQRFCAAFERDDWLQDERLVDNRGRLAEGSWLIPAVKDMIGRRTKADVVALCEQANIPFSPVAHPEDLCEDPHLNQGAGLLETRFPNGLTTKLPRIPIETQHDFGLRLNPPQIGEHTRDILVELGYDAERIGELSERRVVTSFDPSATGESS